MTMHPESGLTRRDDTEVYPPEYPHKAADHNTPLHWHDSEAEEGHQWPKLESRRNDRVEVLHWVVSKGHDRHAATSLVVSITFWHDMKISSPRFPCRAPIPAINSKVLTIAPKVWSSTSFMPVLRRFSLFLPIGSCSLTGLSLSLMGAVTVYPGKLCSRNCCHLKLIGQLRRLKAMKCKIGRKSSLNGTFGSR